MTANPYEGEVALVLDGRRHVLRLTLRALAAMEASMLEDGAGQGVLALVERFEGGVFGSRDVVAVLLAGLRGGGWDGDAAVLLDAEIEGGMAGAARAAALLLGRAFALPRAS